MKFSAILLACRLGTVRPAGQPAPPHGFDFLDAHARQNFRPEWSPEPEKDQRSVAQGAQQLVAIASLASCKLVRRKRARGRLQHVKLQWPGAPLRRGVLGLDPAQDLQDVLRSSRVGEAVVGMPPRQSRQMKPHSAQLVGGCILDRIARHGFAGRQQKPFPYSSKVLKALA
jgi:hypothetical protein